MLETTALTIFVATILRILRPSMKTIGVCVCGGGGGGGGGQRVQHMQSLQMIFE